MSRRLAITLTGDCSNHCVFCAQEGLDLSRVGPFGVSGARDVFRDRTSDQDEVTFTGGEPSLVAELPGLVAEARAAGFRRVGLQTNGGALAADGVLATLAEAGLTDLHVSLHGATAAPHDHVVGRAGAFDQLLASIGSATSAGLDVVATTVVVRSNYRNLQELPRLLLALRIRGWQVAFPVGAGRAGALVDSVVPRLAMALPFALMAVDQAAKAGLPTWVSGVPACLLGPFAAKRLPGRSSGVFGTACEGCPSRSHCTGIDAGYVARFGTAEVVAREVAAPKPENETFARMFVGEGPHAPAGARVSLMPPTGLVALGQSARDEH